MAKKAPVLKVDFIDATTLGELRASYKVRAAFYRRAAELDCEMADTYLKFAALFDSALQRMDN